VIARFKSRSLAPCVWQPTALKPVVPVLRDRCLCVCIYIIMLVERIVLTEIKIVIIIIIIIIKRKSDQIEIFQQFSIALEDAF